MPVTTRPKLPSLTTPTAANFPSDALLSASSVRTTPLSASLKGPLASAGIYSAGLPSAGLPSAPLEYPPTPSMMSSATRDRDGKPDLDRLPDHGQPTPITPPLAYMDFLKTINPASPSAASPPLTAPLMPTTTTTTTTTSSKTPLKRTSTDDSTATTVETIKSEDSAADLDSAPTTASSTTSDCSCDAPSKPPPPPPTTTTKNTSTAPAPAPAPLSAPATGRSTFPSLRFPPSPAIQDAVLSPARSPFSARSVGTSKSPFDWEAALKARRHIVDKVPASSTTSSAAATTPTTRHIREVVTRTVTYTPVMDPAPRGKRRRLNDEVGE